MDPPEGSVSCGNAGHGGIRLSRSPEDEPEDETEGPGRWTPGRRAGSASLAPARGRHVALASRWLSRSPVAARQGRARHSAHDGSGIVMEFRRVLARFFFFGHGRRGITVDASIGAGGIGPRHRGISWFCEIAFTVAFSAREMCLDLDSSEALSRTGGALIHGAVDRVTSSTPIPVWRARSRWARSTVSAVGVASSSVRRVRSRVRVREMASCWPSLACRRMMSR